MNIKFIDLGMQIDSTKRSFAFININTDCFANFNENQIWTSWDEFQNAAESELIFGELEDIKMNCPTWIFQGGA